MCAKTDEEFYNELYEKYSVLLFRFCRGYLSDAGDAEDCMQSVFLCAWKRLDVLRTHENAGGWLMLTAKHYIRKFLRKKGRADGMLPVEECLDFLAADCGEEDILASIKEESILECREEVLKNILSREEFDFFLDYFRGNMPTQELSEKYHISTSTVYVRLHRIKIKLIRYMQED